MKQAQTIRTGVNARNRKGNILPLFAFLLPVLFILTAFAINIAYLQLSRTELMVATDAAARAAGRALSEFQDVDLAKDAALVTAALNSVAGSPLQLSVDDNADQIEFGMSTTNAEGTARYTFTKVSTDGVRTGTELANSVRVSGNRLHSSGGAVYFPFPSFGLLDSGELQQRSVTMQIDRDIALVLDRSGSMSWKTYAWPDGQNPWSYSSLEAGVDEGLLYKYNGNYYYSNGVDSYDYQDWIWEDHYENGPAPNRPWDDLVLAVQQFITVLEATVQTERVSLSSYATTSSEDLKLTSNYAEVINEMNTLSPTGSTAIGYGMQSGNPTLFEVGYGRPLAAKTLIVMTDGMHNTGTDPVTIAQSIVGSYDVTIHTVTFSAGADQQRMQQVADIGGGIHYHAETGAELIDVFEEIANNLPTIVTE